MMLNGGVFVPPTCPVLQFGKIADLRLATFSLSHDRSTDKMVVWVSFEIPSLDSEHFHSVESDVLSLDLDSKLAAKVHRIIGHDNYHSTAYATHNSAVIQMRDVFCLRVANCQGVIDRECQALDAAAVREVLEQIDA